uniref:Uncharacterized protein n=1 Tax=Romanomermis culicivorax TaxID=13658 RepID=A0A915HLW4_ROMCU
MESLGNKPYQQWIFVQQPGPTYIIKLLDNPTYCWQLRHQTSGPGIEITLQPVNPKPSLVDQLFFIRNYSMVPLKRQELVLRFIAAGQGSPNPMVVFDRAANNYNNPGTQWKISSPNIANPVELSVMLKPAPDL